MDDPITGYMESLRRLFEITAENSRLHSEIQFYLSSGRLKEAADSVDKMAAMLMQLAELLRDANKEKV